MEFVWIPPGSFVMGSTPGEASELRALGLWENGFGNEQPALEQTIGEGFYLGKYEITQRQWTAAMGTRPWGAYVFRAAQRRRCMPVVGRGPGLRRPAQRGPGRFGISPPDRGRVGIRGAGRLGCAVDFRL